MFLDTQTNKPSITITYSIVTFLMSIGSIILLYFHLAVLPFVMANLIFWFLATVLYIIRKINKASFDIETKTFSLEDIEATTKI